MARIQKHKGWSYLNPKSQYLTTADSSLMQGSLWAGVFTEWLPFMWWPKDCIWKLHSVNKQLPKTLQRIKDKTNQIYPPSLEASGFHSKPLTRKYQMFATELQWKLELCGCTFVNLDLLYPNYSCFEHNLEALSPWRLVQLLLPLPRTINRFPFLFPLSIDISIMTNIQDPGLPYLSLIWL